MYFVLLIYYICYIRDKIIIINLKKNKSIKAKYLYKYIDIRYIIYFNNIFERKQISL